MAAKFKATKNTLNRAQRRARANRIVHQAKVHGRRTLNFHALAAFAKRTPRPGYRKALVARTSNVVRVRVILPPPKQQESSHRSTPPWWA